jgi:hypothetical protein
MFRQKSLQQELQDNLRALENSGSVGEIRGNFSNVIESLRRNINDKPYSRVKKHVMNAWLDYVDSRVTKSGLFSLVTTDFQKRLENSDELMQLTKLHDDEFIAGVKRIANSLPNGSELKTNLTRSVTEAERELRERRQAFHSNAAMAIAVVDLVLLITKPVAGIFSILCEAVAAINCDVVKLMDQALEIYDSTGYAERTMDDGQTTRQLSTTYYTKQQQQEAPRQNRLG